MNTTQTTNKTREVNVNRVSDKMVENRLKLLQSLRLENGRVTWLQAHYYNGKCNLEIVNAEDVLFHTCQSTPFAGTKAQCLGFIDGAIFAEQTSKGTGSMWR